MAKHTTIALLAPLWLAGTQEVGVAGSASFHGDKLFSYGTVIAQRVKTASGETVYLLNSSGYSDTTSRLQNLVDCVLHDAGYRYLRVPGTNRWTSDTFFDHKRILGELAGAARSLVEDSESCREPKKTRLRTEAKALLDKADAYREMFAVKARRKKDRAACLSS